MKKRLNWPKLLTHPFVVKKNQPEPQSTSSQPSHLQGGLPAIEGEAATLLFFMAKACTLSDTGQAVSLTV